MFDTGSRRSFIVGLLTKVAGGCVAVASLAGLSSFLSGCSDGSGPAPKYGTPDRLATKYGVAFDMGAERGLAPKYGVSFDARVDVNPAVKYGVNTDLK